MCVANEARGGVSLSKVGALELLGAGNLTNARFLLHKTLRSLPPHYSSPEILLQMPLPLAHPAAVLPLRRFCPRFLSLPALFIGSLTPDAGHIMGGLAAFAHSLTGSLLFCWPVGLLLVWICALLKTCVIAAKVEVPDLTRRTSLGAGVTRAFGLSISVLLGVWTHILWDSFTNNYGWVVLHVTALQFPILRLASHQVRICHLLWYASSFVGVALLSMVYSTPPSNKPDEPQGINRATRLQKALICGTMALPIGVIHHLAPPAIGTPLVGALSLVVAAVLVHRARVEKWMLGTCRKLPASREMGAEMNLCDSETSSPVPAVPRT
jgi:hypothetical protein